MTIKKLKIDYNIVRQHLTKPKLVKIKKEKVDFITHSLLLRKSFIVPNKKSYMLSKQDNDARLDNDLHAVFKMNDLFNTLSFYSKDYVYRCGLVSFAGEYFCRLFNFDGIFIKTSEVDNFLNTQEYELNEDNSKINILSSIDQKQNIYNITLSCNYVFNALKILGTFKQYENTSNVLNYKSHTLLDEYLCLLHLMNTSLELYSKSKNLNYYIYKNQNSITFNTASTICDVLVKYFNLYKINIKEENKENFIFTLNDFLNKYCINQNTNKLFSLKEIMAMDNDIIKKYIIHFNKNDKAKTIINSVKSFNEEMLLRDFNTTVERINKCIIIYYDEYFKTIFTHIPKDYSDLLKIIISTNGYNFSPYICKAIICFCNNDSKNYNLFLKYYLDNIPNNTINLNINYKK